MINLLPTDIKANLAYARRNTLMLRWVFAIVVFMVGAGAVIFAGHLYMQRSIDTYKTSNEQSKEALRLQNLEGNQKRLEDISNNIKLVVQVLSKEVLFSELLKQLGKVIPDGATLEQLQIDKVQGGLTLRARAVDIQSATQLHINLQDPANKIFDKADIESINCDQNPADTKNKYKCTIQIKALFTKNNPFLLINKGAGTSR